MSSEISARTSRLDAFQKSNAHKILKSTESRLEAMATAKKLAAAAAGLTSRSSTVFEQRAFFHNLKAIRPSESHFNFLRSVRCNTEARAFTRVLSTSTALHYY